MKSRRLKKKTKFKSLATEISRPPLLNIWRESMLLKKMEVKEKIKYKGKGRYSKKDKEKAVNKMGK